MSAKIIRDPLYNYIGIDRKRDGWLLDVLNSPEIQRLRRIHQLGVSYLTYPGADHNRLVHSLGVLHLMTQMMEHLEYNYEDAQVRRAREPLLAAALVHDVGHGPFSHLFEPCLGISAVYFRVAGANNSIVRDARVLLASHWSRWRPTMRPYSMDLRERVAAAIDAGEGSQRQ